MPDPGKQSAPAEHAAANVFISYSRKDMEFADRLETELKARGFAPTIDRTDIHAFEDWWERIKTLIVKADTVVFIISPDAIASKICREEIAFAASLHKRLAPIVHRRIDVATLPPELTQLNFLFFDDPTNFDADASRLAVALGTDIDWVRKHTEIAEQAYRWLQAGQPGPRGMLLRSPALETAERWIASRPQNLQPPTETTRSFVRESRNAANRRRNTLSVGLAIGLAAALSLAGFAYWQREIAVAQKRIADQRQQEAELTLARSDFAQGMQQVRADQASAAIPRIGRALLLEPTRQSTAVRLASLMTQRWFPRVATTLPKLSDSIKFLRYSHDGRLLLAASAHELALWDVSSKKAVFPPFSSEIQITSVSFSDDDRWLLLSLGYDRAGGSPHGSVYLWDLKAPDAPPRKFDVPGTLWSARFAPDHNSIATASAFGIDFWNLADGAHLPQSMKFSEFKEKISDLNTDTDNAYASFAFKGGGDEMIIVYGVLAPGVVARWSIKDHNLMAIQRLPQTPGPVKLSLDSTSVLLSFPNNYLQFFSFGNAPRQSMAVILDADSLKPKSRVMRHSELISGIEFVPGGNAVVSATEDGGLWMWNASTGEALAFEAKQNDRISAIDVAEHGLLVASGARDGTARLWSTLDAGTHSEIIVHSSAVMAVRFDPAARHLATGTEAGDVSIWDVVPRLAVPLEIRTDAPVDTAALSADGHRLIVHVRDGPIRIFDTATGKMLNELDAHAAVTFHLADAHDIVVIEEPKRFRLVKLSTATAIGGWVDVGSDINQISIDQSHGRFLTASQAGTVDLWDIESGQRIGTPLRHSGPVDTAIFTVDGNVISGAGRKLTLWDPANGKSLKTAENSAPSRYETVGSPQKEPNDVIDLRMTSDNQRVIAIYGARGMALDVQRIRNKYLPEQVGVWSNELAPVATLEDSDDTLTNAALSPDGKIIAASFRDGVVRLWSSETGAQLGQPLRHSFVVQHLAFSHGSDRLIVAGKSDRLSVWPGWDANSRPIIVKTDEQITQLLTGAPSGTFITLAKTGAVEIWDELTGDEVVDPLTFAGQAAFLAVDARGETIASGDGAKNLFIWHLPLPRNEAERCALVEAAESISRLRLNDKDVASPIDGATKPARIFVERCGHPAVDARSPIVDWLAASPDTVTTSPGTSVLARPYLQELITKEAGSHLAIRLMLSNPSDPCARVTLANLLMQSGKDRLTSRGDFLLKQIGMMAALSACDRHDLN